MKKGDKVRVVSIDELPIEEGTNWIAKEDIDIKVGDVFTINETTLDNKLKTSWITLEGLAYWHPVKKFELVKESGKRGESKLLTTTKAIEIAISNMAENEPFSYHDLIKKIRKMPLKNPTVYESSIERIFRDLRLSGKFKIKSEPIDGTNRTRFRKIGT